MKRLACLACVCSFFFVISGSIFPDNLRNTGPKTPQEERQTFQVAPGFRVELVACEPQVMDPVALAFDQDGRLYVAEMRGYPNEGYGTGNIASGCIKLLEDRDGDGFYERATVFADGLRFPTSIMPWRKGILVSVAPDLIYLEDTDGDGKADVKNVPYTGFGIDNIQQLLNSLQWGLDNWIYACNGASGGTIRSVEKPDMAPVSLGNRGIRFHPEVAGSLEPMSGGGQFGLAPDAWQHWFTATNSQHLRQIILPDHYLRRNPGVAAPTPTLDIPEHGAACKVFRISPFEQWRVERTTRRAGGADAARFPKTELVPGGFVTSACSPVVYEAERFPSEYRGSVFICEPANNLILRDKLEDDGPIFRAKRADPGREFFASTDNWCRPVNLSLGPDGALYLVDFYREVIETPRSLPDDMKPKLVLRSQERGRIWRIVPDDHVRGRPPRLSQAASGDLVPLLADPNLWWRLTAQRLLVERQDRVAVPAIKELARRIAFPAGRAHALWTLHGLGALDDKLIVASLKDSSSGVREQALRLAEGRLDKSAHVRAAAIALAADATPRVRFQAAFSLGQSQSHEAAVAITGIAIRDADNVWTRAATLSSARYSAAEILDGILNSPQRRLADAPYQRVVTELATQLAAESDTTLARLFKLLVDDKYTTWHQALWSGVFLGTENSVRPLHRMWKTPPDLFKPYVAQLRSAFETMTRQAASSNSAERLTAARGLAHAPYDLAGPALSRLLTPQESNDIQVAAVRSLSRHDDAEVNGVLVAAFPGAGPALRRELQEALFARPERLHALLDAVESQQIRPQQIEATRVTQLQKLTDRKLRDRALRVLAAAIDANRQKVIDAYKPALEIPMDIAQGREVFRKVCIVCHRLENVGTEVGPDLLAALRDKTPEQLLVSILDPSREVDRRFTNYVVETKAGRTISGLIASETATSITIRRAEKVEDTILRSQIEAMSDTGKSLMPDGLEQQLSKQDVADVIAYLRSLK